MIDTFTHRAVEPNDLEIISRFPQNENELYFMYPKAWFPLTVDQLLTACIIGSYTRVSVCAKNSLWNLNNYYNPVI